MHNGIDIEGEPNKTKVYAVEGGSIGFAEDKGGKTGGSVIIHFSKNK